MDRAPATLVWLDPAQRPLARAVADAAGLRITGAGSPVRGAGAGVAAELGCPALDDLRSAVATAECDLVWIASPGAFGAGGGDEDAAAARRAAERGVRLASLEPIPASALELAGDRWGDGAGAVDPVAFVPSCRHWRALRDASELLEAFGPPGIVAVEACGAGPDGSLGARLFSGLEIIQGLLGEPETIEAAFVSAGAAAGIHALPGETLRGLHGDVAATLRFADGRAASLVASDRAGSWVRSLTLIGAGGRLRVSETGHEWIGAAGEVMDRSGGPADGSPAAGAAVIAGSLKRILDPSPPLDGPATDRAAVLGMAQAALLSCRTGQGESPATIRRMVGA